MEKKGNKIYCFWFGPEMSQSRKNCLQSIIDNTKCEVILVTEENLKQFNIPENPIHKGFEYLSSTHKSDYLRSYFMYYYGGGYTDIKQCNYEWVSYFNELEMSDKLFTTYKENNGGVAYEEKNSFLMYEHEKLGGVCHFIFKKNTEFAKEWLNRTNSKMDEVYDELVKHPGHNHPRTVYGEIFGEYFDNTIKYPLGWNELLGRILHLLMYEQQTTFLQSMPGPNTQNYR